MIGRLDACVKQGKISEYVKVTIVDMSKKVLRQIARKYSNVEGGVGEVMGGKILDYEAKDILNAGIKQGMTQGMARSLLVLLQTLGNVTVQLRDTIMNEKDANVLERWMENAVKADSGKKQF